MEEDLEQNSERPSTRVVALFDANMPSPEPCRPPGCRDDPHYACAHRFGPEVRLLVGRKPIKSPGLSDLGVLRYFMRIARAGISGADIERTDWVVVTRDQTFFLSAKHQYRSIHGPVRQPLSFSNCSAATIIDGKLLHVKAVAIFAKNRIEILWDAISKVRQLLHEP